MNNKKEGFLIYNIQWRTSMGTLYSTLLLVWAPYTAVNDPRC